MNSSPIITFPTRRRKRARQTAPAPSVVIRSNVQPSAKTLRNRRRRQRKSLLRRASNVRAVPPSSSSTGADLFNCYVKTLSNPFESPPCKLGWGTMVPTNIATAYLRYTITANADGSFACFLNPSAGTGNDPIFTNVSGATTATWTHQPFSNATALGQLGVSARIVSGGIKVFPQVPATAAPGIIVAGTIAEISNSTLTSLTPTNLFTYPTGKIGYGARGAMALTLPTDPDSFVFFNNSMAGFAANSTGYFQGSVPYISGLNFPASSLVYCECVINLEILPSNENVAAIQNPAIESNGEPSMLDYFPSLDHMLQSVKRLIPSASAVAEASTVLPSLLKTVGKGVRAYRALRSARQQYFQPGPQSFVSIEELPD